MLSPDGDNWTCELPPCCPLFGRTVAIATSRIRLWPASEWVCQGRHLSRARESLCRLLVLSHGPRWHPRREKFPLTPRLHALVQDALCFPSSNSRRCRHDRGFSGTRRRPACLVVRPSTPRRECTLGRGRKH